MNHGFTKIFTYMNEKICFLSKIDFTQIYVLTSISVLLFAKA